VLRAAVCELNWRLVVDGQQCESANDDKIIDDYKVLVLPTERALQFVRFAEVPFCYSRYYLPFC